MVQWRRLAPGRGSHVPGWSGGAPEEGNLPAPALRSLLAVLSLHTANPDDYKGGFATWSGTSFAAPVLACEIAKSLLSQGMLDDPDVSTAVNCGWRAVGSLVKLARPSQA